MEQSHRGHDGDYLNPAENAALAVFQSACDTICPFALNYLSMLDFSRFEVLTFDCYGTLIDWESGILAALHRLLSAHSRQVDDSTILQLYGDFEQRSESGPYLPYREVLSSVVRQFGDELGFLPTPEESTALPDSLAAWPPWPDTVAALRQLKKRFRLA